MGDGVWNMSFLRLDNVSKNYGDLRVVSDLSLAVEQGEFVSLLGPSGCGKTTTLQMIAGFADVTRGTITLDGRDITHAKPNTRGLGIVFQSYALFPHLTVTDNVAFGLKMRNVERAERQARVREALALVKLDKHADRFPRELSGGQRQRVALARALVIRPPVLLLDEPLSNLDAKLREEMQFELRSIQKKIGTTTVMVTHDQAEALSISDRVVVMQDGRATQVDAPFHMYEHPQSEFISKSRPARCASWSTAKACVMAIACSCRCALKNWCRCRRARASCPVSSARVTFWAASGCTTWIRRWGR
jgi:putative spermidine/putrescine transport system ATP-binding protein